MEDPLMMKVLRELHREQTGTMTREQRRHHHRGCQIQAVVGAAIILISAPTGALFVTGIIGAGMILAACKGVRILY